jgi:acetylornithine/succinyldiaminopimelate/putrescine aminotransferase
VVRVLPPLIVSEDEIAEAVARVDRACTAIERTQKGAPNQETGG